MTKSSFAIRLVNWYRQHGRKNLPWQQNPNAYRIWVSEIMLQQTQYQTVIPYFQRFMQAFPTVKDLANAEEDHVLHLWTGLGYYARARNLHKTAKIIAENYQGQFPTTVDELAQLPGIGHSTAGAIIAFSTQQFAVILEGNVKRVMARYFAIHDEINKSTTVDQLWQLAEQQTPKKNIAEYTQAIMDLGALICTRSKPKCETCPVHDDCLAYQQQLTHLLPRKIQKNAIPTRQTIFLMYAHNGKILLRKRPPIGIWGGLWCFPEINPNELEQHQHPGKIKQIETWQTFRHTFSHFHLQITPVKIELGSMKPQVQETSDQQWIDIDSLPKKGLARPVKTLLEKLQEEIYVT